MASKITVAKATILAAVITGGISFVTWLVGYVKASSSNQPTTFIQTINTGIQVFGDLITGGSKNAPVQPPSVSRVAIQQTQPAKIQFPKGTLGSLTSNTSLLDGATWTLSPAPGDRTLDIDFRTQAEATGDGTGIVTVRLIDSKNTPVCTTTTNSATSVKSGKVFWGGCREQSYLVPANTQIVFRAEAKAENARPLQVELNHVLANPRQ